MAKIAGEMRLDTALVEWGKLCEVVPQALDWHPRPAARVIGCRVWAIEDPDADLAVCASPASWSPCGDITAEQADELSAMDYSWSEDYDEDD